MSNKSLRSEKKSSGADGQTLPPGALTSEDRLWTNNFKRIWIINFALSIWFFLIHAPFPFYIMHLGGNELLIGITAGGVSVAALIMRPFAGWFLDNVSRSVLYVVCVLVIIAASILLFMLPILGLAIILRITMGCMSSGATTASATNAADAIPQSRFGEGIGYLGLGNTLGTALGPFLGLTIIGVLGFHHLFVVSVAVMLFALIIARGFEFKTLHQQKRKKIEVTSLFNKDALPASVVLLFASIPFGGVAIFVALYGEQYGIGFGSWYFILIAVGSGTARLLCGRLIDKVGEKPMVIVGNGCFMTALLLLLFHSAPTYYLSGLFFGFGFGVMTPAMQTMAMRIIPAEKRGAATSTFQCSFDISSGLGGLIAGWLVTVWGYRPMFGSLIVFVGISFIVYALWASKTPSAFKVFLKARKLKR